MLSLPELVQIHFCMQPTDMRKGFDSLAALVRDHLGCDPLSGHLFVFRSRRGDRVKMLCWERDGFTLYYRRSKKARFAFRPPPMRTLTAWKFLRKSCRCCSGASIRRA